MGMHTSDWVKCDDLPCADVRHEMLQVPDIDVDPEKVSIVMISEAAPPDAADYYYASATRVTATDLAGTEAAHEPLFARTTVMAFQDAGAQVTSIRGVLDLGVYLTTAVKCGKTGYGIQAATIKECSFLLERELALFPNVRAYLLMGDVAIRAVNYIAKREGEGRVIPAGSTYKIRGQPYTWRGAQALPSYLQAGPSFFIEKSKRKMIAEDIAEALSLI
jgi:uracil-DNA glycosylase